MKLRLLALFAVLAVLATACGDDTSGAVDAGPLGSAAEESGDAADAMTDDTDNAGDTGDAMTDEAGDAGEAMTDNADEADDASDADNAADDAMRIVSLSPTATEMLFAVGAGDAVVAVDAFSYYPPEAPVTDLSGWEPNVEAIAGYDPTVVYSESPIEGLDALGIDNTVLSAAATIDDVYAQIEQVGAETGHVAEAAELVLEMQTDIDAVLADLPERDTPLTYYHELDTTLYSVTSATFIGQVYSLLGLENVADPADADGSAYGYPQLNEEFLVTADPDVIFLADTIYESQSAETVAARPGWDQLSAVRNGNVIEMNDDIASRWGPRIVEFIQTAGAAVAEIEAVPAS